MKTISSVLRSGLNRAVLAVLAWLIIPGCSIKKIAVQNMADAVSSGGSVYASDDDPELIRYATPSSLKLIESLLAEAPDHKGLLLAACRNFTQYSYAFIQMDADEIENTDLAASTALKARARRMYLRARGYGLRGMELAHPGFEKALRADPRQAVKAAVREDVALLYWLAACWGGAISVSKDDPELIADQPIVEALIDRALELDETFDNGSIDSFLISYESARKGAKGDWAVRARKYFDRAVELSGGGLAGPYVAYAEAVCVQKQDRKGFEENLKHALAIDVDGKPDWRMANLVMQRRARWLLARQEELFVDELPEAEQK